MNEFQRGNLKKVIDGIESNQVALIKSRYFGGNQRDEETMRESECCPIGYMVSLGAKESDEFNPHLFFKRNGEPCVNFPFEMVGPISLRYGLRPRELADLQYVNDASAPETRKEAILAFLKKKIGA